MQNQVHDKQFAALKNLADISGELSELPWHGLTDPIAEQINPLAERSSVAEGSLI
jgi:hypothetical protein